MKLMTKRVLAVVMALALTLGMAVNAMAAWEGVPADDKEAIESVNGGDYSGADFTEKTGFDLGGRDFITIFFNGVFNEEGTSGSTATTTITVTKNADGTFTVTIKGASGYVDVCMLHYSVEKQQWEMQSGTTCTWDTLSPFALVGKKKSSGGSSGSSGSHGSGSKKSSSSSKKSPKTGMDNSWILWLMAAGVFAGSSVIAYNRKRG